MRSAECGMGNAECGMGNGEWGMRNGEWGMGNGEWGILKLSSLRETLQVAFGFEDALSRKSVRFKKVFPVRTKPIIRYRIALSCPV